MMSGIVEVRVTVRHGGVRETSSSHMESRRLEVGTLGEGDLHEMVERAFLKVGGKIAGNGWTRERAEALYEEMYAARIDV